MRLMVAEDDPRLLKTLVHVFEYNKYIVDGVSNGDDALAYAESGVYDGIVLDIMMPGHSGLQVLKKLRNDGITTPVMFLTARTEVDQRVEGLELGADDYLSKPFATSELLARTRAMLRRKDNYQPDLLEFNGLKLNRSTYQMGCGAQETTLSGREYQMLEYLLQRPKSVVPTEEFMTHIWGWNSNVDTSVIWVHVSNLRKKLASIGAPVEIRFIRSAGYILEEKQ